MRACDAVPIVCAETFTITFAYYNGSTLISPAPTFITTYSTSRQMTFAPLTSNIGVYTIKVTFVPTNLRSTTTLAQYNSATLTVGCIITSIAEMSSSSLSLTYRIFKDTTVILDFGSASVSPNT